jgi:hypothetical protein
MNTTVAEIPGQSIATSQVRTRAESIPWYLWASVVSTACISIGLYWDISWHMTIGRDTFWTPAHLLIQFGAVLAGICAGYLILTTTFGHGREARDSSVRIMGFLGPLGAFITAWGAIAMVVSAPFDNWWHNAYGLDVKIISPPHQILGFGIEGIGFGCAILIVGAMNRAEGVLRTRLEWLLLALGGLILTHSMMGRLEYTDRATMHGAVMYLALAIGPPFVLEAFARPAGARWGRTAVAGIYTFLFLLGLWIFPLFPGEPKLGPVYQRVTHMIPLAFPILIIAPAMVLDWIWPRLEARWPKPDFGIKWAEAAITGVVYLAALLAAQWPFAYFMASPSSGNWFFGTHYHPYMVPSDWPGVTGGFVPMRSLARFWIVMGWAVFASILCTRLGIMFGNWMRKVQR